MAHFRTLDDLGDIKGKRVLVRVDLNVPMADGKAVSYTHSPSPRDYAASRMPSSA